MATVETLDKDRILAIEGNTVIGGTVTADNLVLTRKNGETINAGNVRGATGPAGPGIIQKTVADIKYPLIIAHRGSAKLFPEQSMEGLEWSSEAGFAIEVDVYLNASGSLVNCHDATVTRTMSGISGNVVDSTDTQWLQARLKSPVRGGSTAAPTFFEDVLDRFGGRVIIVPEIKTSDDASVNAFMQAILERGLNESVIAQSFNYAVCTRMAANGLNVLYLTSGSSFPQSPTTIKAAEIDFVGFNVANPTSATVASFVAAGIKVIGYNVTNPTSQELGLGKGMVGVFSDDPWFSSRRILTSGNLPLDDPSKGALWPGAQFLWAPGAGDPVIAPEPPHLAFGGVGIYETAAAPKTRVLNCPWAEPTGPAFVAVIKGIFGTDSENQSDSIGGVLWKNGSNADAEWEDRAKVGQSGYTWLVRRNGQIAVWEYVNGSVANLIASTTAGDDNASYVAPPNNLGQFLLVLQHTGSSLRLSLTDTNRPLPQSVSVSNTNTKTAMKFALRYSSSGFVTDASVASF